MMVYVEYKIGNEECKKVFRSCREYERAMHMSNMRVTKVRKISVPAEGVGK